MTSKPSLKKIGVLLLLVYIVMTSFSMYLYESWSIIQYANLIFHEAGHVFCMLFGSFLHVLGGTLFELGVPLIVAGYFYFRHDMVGTGFGLWWLSTALWSVSIYAKDARLQSLTLLGGDSVEHDWSTILGTLHLLPFDTFIGTIFLFLSILALACALTLLGTVLKQELGK